MNPGTAYRFIDVYSFEMYRKDKARARRKWYGVPRYHDELIDELDDPDGTQYKCKYGLSATKGWAGKAGRWFGWTVHLNVAYLEAGTTTSRTTVRLLTHELSHLYEKTTDQDWGYLSEDVLNPDEPKPYYQNLDNEKIKTSYPNKAVVSVHTFTAWKSAYTIGGYVSTFYVAVRR